MLFTFVNMWKFGFLASECGVAFGLDKIFEADPEFYKVKAADTQ